MSERIVFADGTSFPCPEQPQAPVHRYRDGNREWRRITVTGEMAAVKIQIIQTAAVILVEIMILEQILKTQMMKVAIQ